MGKTSNNDEFRLSLDKELQMQGQRKRIEEMEKINERDQILKDQKMREMVEMEQKEQDRLRKA